MNDVNMGADGVSAETKRRRHPLARGIELITLMVDSENDVHGVRELAGRLEVSPSTVHRLVTDLEQLGLVARTANGSYRLGLEFMRLAWTAVERYPIQEVSTDTLEELTEHSGESSFFAVYGESRQQMMFALSVESPHPLRYTLPLNKWLPLHAGASGQAILAFLPDEIVQQVVWGTKSPLTERTLVEPSKLLERLDHIARDGFAITHGERIDGAIAIASPVFGPAGTVVGSLGISIPDARFNAAYSSSLASLVKQAAGRITDYLTGARDAHTGIRRG